jgi:hypothetical protein
MSDTRTNIDYPITPTSFQAVSLQDTFWLPRLETNRTVTIPDVLRKCEEFGRVDNFSKASKRLPGAYCGKMPFEDTDVYKAIEGASFSLAEHSDPSLETRLDALIDEIAAAQEPDGYLYTNRTIDPVHVLPFSGPQRWSNLVMSHELYNCGHLYEAACAHFTATGKRALLGVALRNAELICRVFGPEGRHDISGHQIVEMGLARLYRITKDRRFLEQARFFLEQRGHHERRPLYQYEENPGYCQDHKPVVEQREAVGHAVRAAYMYCGMADVAALMPDRAYATAIEAIWRDVVGSKIYLTGGIGARHKGEAFGDAFELPNLTAYAETCASIGSVMWNHRLMLLSGDSRYVDVLEQTLYNGLLSGVSLGGDKYFYTNPLESDGIFQFNYGSAGRQGWFDVSCCPTNICRFFPSLPGYVYATAERRIYVNLFIAGRARVETAAGAVEIVQETEYPWSGIVRFALNPSSKVRLQLLVRVPGWARETILGGSLYSFERPAAREPSMMLNGQAVGIDLQNGYAVIDREWESGDTLELALPMQVRKVLCDPRVSHNRGKAALQRGPVVYCVEGQDAQVSLESLSLSEETDLRVRRRPDLLGGIVEIHGRDFAAIPYYAWANRGPGPMRVWLRNRSQEPDLGT